MSRTDSESPLSSGKYSKSLVNLSPMQVLKTLDVNILTEEQLASVEADSYHCLSKVMLAVEDHYTSGQPGIKKMVLVLRDRMNNLLIIVEARIKVWSDSLKF